MSANFIRSSVFGAVALFGFGVIAPCSQAYATTWNWTFAGEQGTIITDGVSTLAGTYNYIDFSVSLSSVGNSVGSVSGGQYGDGTSGFNFSTSPPYSFIWDGIQVTDWIHGDTNTAHWWVFRDLAHTNRFYFFGYGGIGDSQDLFRGLVYDFDTGLAVTQGPLSFGDFQSSTPLPTALPLFATGLGALGLLGWRRKRKQSA